MMKVNTREAKERLTALLAQVERTGEAVTICRNGKPVAKLVAVSDAPTDPFQRHPHLLPVVFHEDPCAPLDWGGGVPEA